MVWRSNSVWTRHQPPSVGALRHLVWICTTVERPDPATPSTLVEKPGVIRVHARIRNLRPDQILDYQGVFGTERAPGIEITIRNPPDVKIDLNHWVYRADGFAKIWYKVRNVEPLGELERFLVLNCSIDVVDDSRSDPATQTPPPRWDDPEVGPTQVLDRI